VHFPLDSAAGLELGASLWALLVPTDAPADPQADAFQWLLHQARSEWVP